MEYMVYGLPTEKLKEGELNFDEYTGEFKNYLCVEKDFKVGDKIYWFDPEKILSGFDNIIDIKVGELDDEGKALISYLTFGLGEVKFDEIIKVVAEISPNVTWVDESTVLTEEEVQIKQVSDGTDFDTEEAVHLKNVALIKGPCGHFH